MEVSHKNLTRNDFKKISRDLIITVNSEYGAPKQYKIYEKNTNVYNLPLYWASKNLDRPIYPEFKTLPVVNDIKLLSKPRPIQESCMVECKKELDKEWGGGIISLQTGGGKSYMALMLFEYIELKMLVVVHTIELFHQWERAINQFLPGVKVGRIQGKVFDIKGKDIVIGMLQTISMKSDIKKDDFNNFGLVIYDEVQFLSAEVFSKALLKSRARYTFGMSATVERTDGLESVFKHHIGDIIFSDNDTAVKQNTILNIVKYTNLNFSEKVMYNGTPNISAMITDLSLNKQRTKVIIDEINKLPKNRNVLVLSERVEHLKYMQKIVGDVESGLFTGSTKDEEKIKTKQKRIMFATYAIASVGFDHPKLNTLVFATPRSNVTQAIGRIYRKIHGIPPMIVDIVDTNGIFPYQYKKRQLVYKKSFKQAEVEVECLFD